MAEAFALANLWSAGDISHLRDLMAHLVLVIVFHFEALFIDSLWRITGLAITYILAVLGLSGPNLLLIFDHVRFFEIN